MKYGLLLSGGMDSTALAYWKRPDVAITVDYGQVPAEAEVQASGQVCATLGIRHELVRVDCRGLGSGDLAGREAHELAATSEWWPYRNQLLITLAAMRAVALGVQQLMIATVSTDGNYRDGTDDFIRLLDRLVSFQEGGMRITAPAIGMSSTELVRASGIPFDVLAWAHSCHKSNFACGDCRGCYKHQQTMYELGYGFY